MVDRSSEASKGCTMIAGAQPKARYRKSEIHSNRRGYASLTATPANAPAHIEAVDQTAQAPLNMQAVKGGERPATTTKVSALTTLPHKFFPSHATLGVAPA